MHEMNRQTVALMTDGGYRILYSNNVLCCTYTPEVPYRLTIAATTHRSVGMSIAWRHHANFTLISCLGLCELCSQIPRAGSVTHACAYLQIPFKCNIQTFNAISLDLTTIITTIDVTINKTI